MRTIPYAALLALILIAQTSVRADRLVSTDIIQDGGTFVVDPAGKLTISFYFGNPLLTLTNGANSTGVNAIVVGRKYSQLNEHGQLRLEKGSSLSNKGDAYLGDPQDSFGTATVSNSQWWNNTGDLIVGNNGNGVLDVDSNGIVTSANAYLARYGGSMGSATVDSSTWLIGESLSVGHSGIGALSIKNNGIVLSRDGIIGNYGTGTLSVIGDGSRWQNSGNITVGGAGTGSLNIIDGGVVTSSDAMLGDNRNSGSKSGNGVATVSGNGSLWQNKGNLYVGYFGKGELNVEHGAVVTSKSGRVGYTDMGNVTVRDGGSHWQNSGLLSVDSGILTVSAGGIVTTKNLSTYMSHLRGDGDIYANGAFLDTVLTFNSELKKDIIFGDGGRLHLDLSDGSGMLGIKGNGNLAISDGIHIKSSEGYLQSFGIVTGANTKWEIGYSLYVTNSGSSNLRIADGAIVTDSNAIVSGDRLSSLTAIATVVGTGSQWQHSDTLYIGYNLDPGELIITDGGLVTSQKGVIGDGYSGFGNATVLGQGSKWHNLGDLFIGTRGPGILEVQEGGTVEVDGLLTVGGQGVLSVSEGTIRGNVFNRGIIDAGNSPAMLLIDGDLNSTGVIEFQIAGLADNLYDHLFVTDELKLGGLIKIKVLDGFVPPEMTEFKILDFRTFMDRGYQFDFSHAGPGGNLAWDTSTFAVDGTIRFIPEVNSLVLAGIGAMAGFIGWRTKNRAA